MFNEQDIKELRKILGKITEDVFTQMKENLDDEMVENLYMLILNKCRIIITEKIGDIMDNIERNIVKGEVYESAAYQ